MIFEILGFFGFIIMLVYLHRDHMRRRDILTQQFAELYKEIKKLEEKK